MTNHKLIKSDRDAIRHRLLRHRYEDQVLAFMSELQRLADRFYEASFSRGDKIAIAECPEGWLPTIKSVKIRVAGTDVEFQGDVSFYYIYRHINASHDTVRRALSMIPQGQRPEGKTWRVPACRQGSFLGVFDGDDKLAQDYEVLRGNLEDLVKEISTTKMEIDAVLRKSSTSASLIKAWPEIKEIVEDVLGSPQVPALPIEALNTRLGLGEAA